MAQRTASLPAAQRAETPARAGFRLTPRTRGIIIRQIFLQLFLLIMLATVLFPVLWIISMAIDPRGITRPTDLTLFPANANLDAFGRILTDPFSNVLPLYFGDMLMNSLFIALGTSLFTVVLGSSAAYAFSRFRFIGRQVGMLGFIILLMLPATGLIIPLYVLFTSVQINTTLAQFPPAFFNAAVVVGLIWMLYNTVRTFGKRDPERSFNPSPLTVAIGTAIITLLLIVGFFYITFERSPVYASFVKAPVAAISGELNNAKSDYDRRVTSVAQRERTAIRQEDAAARNAALLALLEDIQARTSSMTSTDEIAAVLQAQIDDRLADGFENSDPVVSTLQTVLLTLTTGGVEGYQTGLISTIESTRADLARSQSTAATARANAEEAAAGLSVAEDRLIAAREAFNASAAGIYGVRDQAIIQMIPYMLLAWGAALAGAGVVWFILSSIKHIVPPRMAINIIAWGLLLSILITLTSIALQGRLAGVNPGGTQTLRTTLLGLALAFASGGLPFAVWNLKGYFDTIPKELEEAALIDGAGLLRTFIQVIVPLALPAFAIVILFSFMQGWTEFILSWVFLTGTTKDYTLAMALATMAGGANQAPPDMQKFAAMAILISAPIMILFFAFQRWIVGGLSIGGVKG
jgi:ABC-type maltose transport system permease subunit